jgi:chromosome segregation ATPase
MLEASLAPQAANSDSYKHALFNKATSKNVRERFKDLTSLARGDNLKVLAVMQGGAVHPHVQAQIEYAEKLKALESRINDRMEDISKELVTMNAYIAELDDKECNFDPAEWDYDQQIGEVRNKLEELESDVSAATNACLKDIMGIAETGDKVAKKVDALTKNTAGLRKENEELKIALEKCQTEVNEHRALLKSVVEAMT